VAAVVEICRQISEVRIVWQVEVAEQKDLRSWRPATNPNREDPVRRLLQSSSLSQFDLRNLRSRPRVSTEYLLDVPATSPSCILIFFDEREEQLLAGSEVRGVDLFISRRLPLTCTTPSTAGITQF
jgi:hypothetical protein